ncbi:MAG: hypothetical protein P8X74_08105 [Reinekea sp.]
MACALRRYGVTDSGKTHIKMTRRLKVLWHRYYSQKRRPTLREALQKSTASFQLLTREGQLPSSCASR